MPQALVPIIGGLFTGLSATAVTVLAYGVTLVGTMALSQYQKRKAERAARAQYDAAQVDRLINLPSTVAPRELVLGRVRKGGTIFYRGTTGAFFNGNLWVCIALAGHEIDGVEQIYFNDEPVSVNGAGMVTTLPYGGRTRRTTEQRKAPSQTFDLGHVPDQGTLQVFKNRGLTSGTILNPDGTSTHSGTPVAFTLAGSVLTISEWETGTAFFPVSYQVIYQLTEELSFANVRVHLGGADQAADAWMQSAMPPGVWTSAHRARGAAYLVANFLFDENAFQSGPPNITVKLRGAKCYDPRTGSTAFTENPALHMLHVLLHPRFGKRTLASMTAGELARINAAANACELATDYGQGLKPRYRSALVAPFGASARDLFDDLSQSMAGMWAYAAGELYVRAGVWQAPVMHLTDDDLAVVQRGNDGAVSQSPLSIGVHRARNETVNTIVARIWDERANYVQTPLAPFRDGGLVANDGAELSQEVVMPAVFYWQQAHHIAYVMLRDARDPLTAVLPFKLKAYPLELFDSITLSLRRYGWVAKEFIILGRTFTPEGMVQLTLKETSAAIYAPGAPALPDGYADNTQLPRPWDIKPPAINRVESGESVLVVQGDGTIINGVRVQWAPIADPSITSGAGSIEVQYRPVTSEAWRTVTVDGAASEALLTGLSDLAWIVIRARTRSTLATSDWSSLIYHQVIGKSEPPPDFDSLAISGSVLSWSLPYRPPDLAGYVFRFHYGNNTDWGSATPLHTGVLTESPYDLVTRPGGVVTIMGKALDTSGNASSRAAVVITDLGDPPIANVLEEWDFGALDWPGDAGDQSGWSLVGGLPTADAIDSFYGEDSQSFYSGDAQARYLEGAYVGMAYVTPAVSIVSALAGSIMTLAVQQQGIDLRVEYRLIGPAPLYGMDDQPFFPPAADPMYGAPSAWLPWPGQLVVQEDAYQFRVSLGAGATRGVLESLVLTVDAPDIVEEIADAVVPSAGLVIPYLKPFTAIKTIQVTLQANLSGAVTTEIDKTNPLAPRVRAFNAAHVAVAGASVDITIKGY